MPSKIVLLGLICLSVASCVTQSNMLANGDNMALGQTANIDGPMIRPVKILEDSRCPINARCISAGDVRLQVEWVRRSGNQTVEVALSKPAQIADGQLTLTRVLPQREAGSGKAPKPSDYQFSFKFDGGL